MECWFKAAVQTKMAAVAALICVSDLPSWVRRYALALLCVMWQCCGGFPIAWHVQEMSLSVPLAFGCLPVLAYCSGTCAANQ